jgi:hypothetical protein
MAVAPDLVGGLSLGATALAGLALLHCTIRSIGMSIAGVKPILARKRKK